MSSCSQVRDSTQIKTDSKITKFQLAPLKSSVSQPFFHYHHALALKRDTLVNHLACNFNVRYPVHHWQDCGSCPVTFALPDRHNTTCGAPTTVLMNEWMNAAPALCYRHQCHSKGHLFTVPLLEKKIFHLEKYKQNTSFALTKCFLYHGREYTNPQNPQNR